MRVGWVYLDKKAAVIRAVNDYTVMNQIILNYNTAIEEARTRMTAAHSPVLSLAPGSSNVLAAGEERIAETIDAISVIEERHNCAVEYMQWFLPAWHALSDVERVILSEFYHSENISRNVLISNLSCELFIERAQIYRYKDKALERLAVLLYGL